jgi:chromosomal replication initiation ATPase DnaA
MFESGDYRKRCPSCNKRAKKSDVRALFVAFTTVQDTSARDEVLKRLEEETSKRIKVSTVRAVFARIYKMTIMYMCSGRRKQPF